jgi:uncharacterized protein (TIGR03083 family)
MNKDQYLAYLHADGAALIGAAQRDLSAPVPGCPGWSTKMLLGHMGWVWTAWVGNLRANGAERAPRHEADFTPWPGLWEWLEDQMPADRVPDSVVEWAPHQLQELEAELAAAELNQPCWTWFPADQTAGFAMRRMALEAAVHRWDAQSATGIPEPIDRDLARDGINEMFDIHVPTDREWENAPPGSGESYHFHPTDGDGEWLVRFDPGGMTVTPEHAKGDVAVRGSASDLLLFLWGRIPAEQLQVFGDRTNLARYRELAPTGE